MPRLTVRAPALFFLLAVLGLAQSTDDAATGVWPWLVGPIDASVPAIVQQAQAADLDTIYLHLWRTDAPGTGTLYMVDEASGFDPAWGSLQPYVTLSQFISQAHAAGIQVVGVVNCFLSGGPLPGNGAHEQLLLEVIDHLVHSVDLLGNPRYPLDGIALDRIRYYSGTNNSPAVVNAFIQQVKSLIGTMPLHAFIPANLFHIDGPPYDGSFRSYTESQSLLAGQFGHDWEQLAPLLDVMLPMAYVAEGGLYGNNTSLMQAYVNRAASFARTAATNAGVPGRRVMCAVRAWNDSSGTTTAASLDGCMTGAVQSGTEGFMTFRYFTSQGQTSWWSAVANRADSGATHPIARLQATPQGGQSVLLDASTSSSQLFPPGFLTARFDLDDDGVPDTSWSPNLTRSFLAPGPGSWPVAVEVRDPFGNTGVRKRVVVSTNQTLTAGPPGILSLGLGGTIPLSLDLGPAGAAHPYLVLASLSGSQPGFPLGPDLTLPLNQDAATEVILDLANSPFFPGFLGALDASGAATGAVALPPAFLPPALLFQSLTLAAVTADPVLGGLSAVTNSASFLFIP